MKILLITSPQEDYLQDSIIHGFKELFGNDAVDYPVKNILYNDCDDLKTIRGNGFTLYGLLSSSLKNKTVINLEQSIKKKDFALIIFTSIYRQYEIFYTHVQLLIKSKIPVWIMDGEDSPILFPYLGMHLKKFFDAVKPHKHFIYFKRELSQQSLNSLYLRFPMQKLGKKLFPKNIQPIAFSIPKEKIIKQLPVKKKAFTTHIVDAEIAAKVYGEKQQALFENEIDYYKDIQESKFGITTKRAGWDCLRHYEIAANGAVICFKNLQDKPEHSAPHGLTDGKNCISYLGYDDLINSINKLTNDSYTTLQQNSLKWAHENSTKAKAESLLNNYFVHE